MKIYGIRHHGPGCARSLVRALDEQSPDIILVEAPSEMDALLADVANPGMKPPIAALLYQTDDPQSSSFYPFARFSPEWQALQWAHQHECKVRCFDLPAANYFALDAADREAEKPADDTENPLEDDKPSGGQEKTEVPLAQAPLGDPFEYFARADGYTDGERWWNDKMEERSDSASFFDAVLEAVTALRSELNHTETPRTLQREATMRKHMRAAKREGFENIAVVCGAWHAPALATMPKVSEDNALLKGLPKVKVSATWTPWSYERLTSASGYGAGIRSPGWYDHLWSRSKYPFTTWMTKAARVLRKQDIEGSSASIIEATRLSESLAGLRGRPRPGLDESLEAMRTVFCNGDSTPLALLQEPLLIGKQFGEVPEEITNLPLQRDIEATQKRLRLKPTAEARELVLDLREDSGRNRSVFLHRLLALQIHYGKKRHSRSQGTFKETWTLLWKPKMILQIVDASQFGNTLIGASGQALLALEGETSIEDITERLDLAILADLSDVAPVLVIQLDQSAASTSDALELMKAVPTLVRIVRYGDVRQTDAGFLMRVVVQLTTRIAVALPPASTGLADDSAHQLVDLMRRYADAVTTLQDDSMLASFRQSLSIIANSESSSAEPAGCATRLLYEANEFDTAHTAKLFSFALSAGNEPAQAAAWLEGFLSGAGSVLVHDTALLALIDNWLKLLPEGSFVQVLPLLRRTFGQFTAPERSRIGQAVQSDSLQTAATKRVDDTNDDVDIERALPAIATVAKLFNLPEPG